MRIAFVSPLFPSPAEPFRATYNYKLVVSLRKMADVEVFSPRARLPLRDSLRPISAAYRNPELGTDSTDLPATYIPYPSLPLLSRPLNWLACAIRLRPFLERSRPDLMLASWVHPEGYGALHACRRLGIPVVIQALGTDLRRVADPLGLRVVSKTMTHADAVITVSRELKEWAVRYGADPAKVYPVLNGSDTAVFHPRDRREMRRKLELPADAELVLFVGSLIRAKGLNELLDASLSVFPRRPNLRVAIIGNGVLKEAIRSRVESSGQADRFHLLGPRSAWEIGEWLGAANLLCLPSYSEGCPNVVVEALSSGRPVIASNVGGVPELVCDGTGILIPPADAGALTQALEAALDRRWDEDGITRTAGRSWDQAAAETYAVCRAVYDHARRGTA
jgi:teichuronic acid biosynthesis glycosyltransferase TuaC